MSHEQSETVQRGDGRWINVYGARTPNAGKQLPDSGDYATVNEAVSAAKSRSESYDIGAVHLPPPRTASDDTGAIKLPPPRQPITKDERRTYTEALPGTPEGAKTREGIEAKHGGAESFRQEFDPVGEFIGQRVLPPVLETAALSMIPGGALARIGAAAGMGTGKAVARGESLDKAGWTGLLDGLAVGVVEGVTKGVGGVLRGAVSDVPLLKHLPNSAAARAYKFATEAPEKALAAIRSQLPPGRWVNAPTLSKKLLTPEEAVAKFKAMKGKDYERALDELASEFKRLDVRRVTGPKNPSAGREFKRRVSPERFDPPASSRVADVAERALTSPVGHGVADAAAMEHGPGGTPLGLVAGAALADAPGHITHRLLPAVTH